jgi:hypothetical protein
MAKWLVKYAPHAPRLEELARRPVLAGVALERPCFRVCPADQPERWIVETNPNLPREVQEEFALQIAQGLFDLLGV